MGVGPLDVLIDEPNKVSMKHPFQWRMDKCDMIGLDVETPVRSQEINSVLRTGTKSMQNGSSVPPPPTAEPTFSLVLPRVNPSLAFAAQKAAFYAKVETWQVFVARQDASKTNLTMRLSFTKLQSI